MGGRGVEGVDVWVGGGVSLEPSVSFTQECWGARQPGCLCLYRPNGSNPAGFSGEQGSGVIHFALWLATRSGVSARATLHWLYRSGVRSECHKIHKQPRRCRSRMSSEAAGSRCGVSEAPEPVSGEGLSLALTVCEKAILPGCNYTSLIDNAEKLHWFGVSRRSVPAPAPNYFSVLQCQVRFPPPRLRQGCGRCDHTWTGNPPPPPHSLHLTQRS